jgi:nucleoside-diphosphate-sugar epimerase
MFAEYVGAGQRSSRRSIKHRFVDCSRFEPLLTEVSSVVHAAARVHVMNETSSDPLADFRLMNVEVTLRLAQAGGGGWSQSFYLSEHD